MQDVSMEMISLPLLFYVQMSCLKYVHTCISHICYKCPLIHTHLPRRIEECRETLKELSEMASKADDLRAHALYDCCHYDALLDTGKFHTANGGLAVYIVASLLQELGMKRLTS